MTTDFSVEAHQSIKSTLSQFWKKHSNELFVFFILFVLIFTATKMPTHNGGLGGAEQWSNLTNQMFYGNQDFLFSYGPMNWITGWTTSHYSALTYWTSAVFLSTLYAGFWTIVFTLTHQSRAYIFLALAYFLFYGNLQFSTSLLLWSFTIITYLEFSKPDTISLQTKELVIVGLLVGFSFYIRFFYGIVALATFGTYFVSRFLISRKFSETVIFIVAVVFAYICTGLAIFHDQSSLITYFIVNNQLSFGNSVDMRLDVQNTEASFFAVALIVIFFNIYLVSHRRSLLFTVNVLLLIFFKIGFSRTDHYTGYFIVPVAALALVMVYDKRWLGRLMFISVMASLYFIAAVPIYPKAATLDALQPPVDFNQSYSVRMQNAYADFKLSEDVLNRIGRSTIDVYPYLNEYMFANNLNYRHRPLFQNYMTLTPTLDAMNQRFFESPDRPKFILWTTSLSGSIFEDFDQKFSLNEDPLTTSAIFLNYHLVMTSTGKDGTAVMLFEENDTSTAYSSSQIAEQTMQFRKWYRVPQNMTGVVKLSPKLEFTTLGKIKNLLFRGSVLEIKYKMQSGKILIYRQNILNSQSGIWASPLPDSADLSGDGVDAIMLESKSPNYFKPTFNAKWIIVPISTMRNRQPVPVFDLTLPSNPEVKNEIHEVCDGNIDSVNGEPITAADLDVTGSGLEVGGWLAASAKSGTAADKIYVTLTDREGKRRFIATHIQNRPDVASAYNQPGLSVAGYQTNIDISALKGNYKLGMAGIHNDVLFSCTQFDIPLILNP